MDKKFITSLQGKEFILLAGLLNEFHINGGKSIETNELENSTLEIPKFKATVSGEKGTFTGHGDADKSNVNTMVAKHKYRMAETRAIARALRWYNNIGMCSADEMGGKEEKEKETPANTMPPEERNMENTDAFSGELVYVEQKKYGEKVIGEKCPDCAEGKFIKNPHTGKVFCSEKCWLKK